MGFKVSGGQSEDGVVFGNAFDKYGSKNPIVKWMMKGFDTSLENFVVRANPETIHEVGCGEGFWVNKWNSQGLRAVGSDFSYEVISLAQENAANAGLDSNVFSAKSIYDLKPETDSADLIVCCEVMEHLEDPDRAMKVLQSLVKNYLIISVPREPVWCVLNMARGKYLKNLGNTPGHIQHWSKRAFVTFTGRYFKVIEVSSPFPWTMLMCVPHDKK
ncbi:methyltransferase type 11 [Leclercia sp. LSNIH6]|uniref:class I SAM-dependent methyltransferase n=1 Tax=Leclercia sp. TaxID=1898428 RepID=UPI000CDD3743|nr:class I SAM-dependent methyltransferase [Leclercia sp.]POU77314.1 methyltransferase type 11 [Leclercia sp. LSNIH7]POU79769.1 methyltransferase type 11 [Leclercia sp. LSNIH6]POW51223.1 methyltransferase type 11 [Leclercia sp. LSNIH8]